MKCLDGYISVAPYTDERWVRFFDVTGHADFLKREELCSARDRFLALDRMYAEMARIVAGKPLRYWLALCAECDIPASQEIYVLEDTVQVRITASSSCAFLHRCR